MAKGRETFSFVKELNATIVAPGRTGCGIQVRYVRNACKCASCVKDIVDFCGIERFNAARELKMSALKAHFGQQRMESFSMDAVVQ